jgi:hypothetical protein
VSDTAAGKFEKVWRSKAEYRSMFCAVIDEAKKQLKGKGSLAPTR